MRFRAFLFSCLAMCSTVAHSEIKSNDPALSVELLGKHKLLQFENEIRLSDIIILAQENGLSLSYPLASTLFDSSPDAENASKELKLKVLSQLEKLGEESSSIYGFIEGNDFSPRLISHLDFDDIRLDKRTNPLLKGTLTLSAPERVESIIFIGNIKKTYKTNNYKGLPLSSVLENIAPLAKDMKVAPVVIYPDAHIAFPKPGSWDTKEYYLPPLSIVYIPFEEYKTSQLDRDIVKLLTQLKTPL